MTFPRIIGLSGKAQHGKDTVATILHDLYGYERIAFADALRRCVLALNPWVDPGGGIFESSPVRVSEALEDMGYEDTKVNHPEYTRLLQAMGTEVGRDILGEDIWVNTTFKNAPVGKLLVITDVRFPNEYNAVKDRGGEVWRVNRIPAPALTRNANHPSEWALDEHSFDHILPNEGTVRDLADKVMDILDRGNGVPRSIREAFHAVAPG